MANSTTCYDAAVSAEFQNRVRYFLIKAAVAVMSEDAGTANHAERAAFARRVLGGTAAYVNFALACATNGTLAAQLVGGAEISDNDLEFTVNSLVDAFSL